MQKQNREIHLANRPVGTPSEKDFRFVDATIPTPKDEEVLIKTLYLSVDPYMRGRMNDAESYIPPFELNKAITGGVVGEVMESKSAHFKAGDIVTGNLAWAECSVTNEQTVRHVGL